MILVGDSKALCMLNWVLIKRLGCVVDVVNRVERLRAQITGVSMLIIFPRWIKLLSAFLRWCQVFCLLHSLYRRLLWADSFDSFRLLVSVSLVAHIKRQCCTLRQCSITTDLGHLTRNHRDLFRLSLLCCAGFLTGSRHWSLLCSCAGFSSLFLFACLALRKTIDCLSVLLPHCHG